MEQKDRNKQTMISEENNIYQFNPSELSQSCQKIFNETIKSEDEMKNSTSLYGDDSYSEQSQIIVDKSRQDSE